MARVHRTTLALAAPVALVAVWAILRMHTPAPAPAGVPVRRVATAIVPAATTVTPGTQAGLPTETPPVVTLVAVGDIMLSRTVGQVLRDKHDVRFPYERTRDAFHAADMVFANLETSVTPGRPIKQGEMTFRADPDTVDGLKDAGVTVVSLANNHTPNFGQKGLTDTFRYLHDAGIAYAGAGPDLEAARAPVFLERGGMTFAFLAYNDHDVVPPSYGAGPGHAGTSLMDVDAMTEAVREAKTKADVVIVSMHSGREYTFVPDDSQKTFARAAIDAGADLVIGHHPHTVQTFERYQGKPILYSLGNFVFDQMWSTPTREGLMTKIVFRGPRVDRIELQPVWIEQAAQPRPSDPPQAAQTLARLGERPATRAFWTWDAATRSMAEEDRPVFELGSGDAAGTKTADADVDGDGHADAVSIDAAAAPGDCATGAVVFAGLGGAENGTWRSAPGCYSRLEVSEAGDRVIVSADRE